VSAYSLPSLPGLLPEVERVVTYATTVHATISGKEQRTTWQSTPRKTYRLRYGVLREGVTVSASGAPWHGMSEVAALQSVFDTHKGQWDSFSYTDPLTTSSVTVRFVEDSVTWTRIVPGAWTCEFELIEVK
jgi:hypothetical protein